MVAFAARLVRLTVSFVCLALRFVRLAALHVRLPLRWHSLALTVRRWRLSLHRLRLRVHVGAPLATSALGAARRALHLQVLRLAVVRAGS